MAKASAKASTAPISIFGAAPTIVTAPAAGKKATAPVIKIDHTQEVASLTGVIAMLTAVLDVRKAEMKAQAETHFKTEGRKIKRKPENIRSVEGIGSASLQLRATSGYLSAEAIELCDEHGIAYDTEEKVADTFVFGSAYAADTNFVAKLDKLLGPQLAALQDERGPIILKQAGVSRSKITDAGRDAIFAKSEEILNALLPVAFTLSVSPKLETGGDLKPALKIVEEILGSPLWKDIASEAATNPSALEKKTKEKQKKAA